MRKSSRFLLGTFTVLLLALTPSVVPVGGFVAPASAAVAGTGRCAQTVSDADLIAVSDSVTNECVLTFSGSNNGSDVTRTWTPPSGVSKVRVLVVGGGGAGGGDEGGGGGAGLFIQRTDFAVASNAIDVQVGAGGTGTGSFGDNGGDSRFGNLIATGGGGGGEADQDQAADRLGRDGGSGGGGAGERISSTDYVGSGGLARNASNSTPDGVNEFGNNGAPGTADSVSRGGGGGGAGGAGVVGGSGGTGGIGKTSSISGSTITYAAGGGGGRGNSSGAGANGSTSGGAGGSGIGGSGGDANNDATDGNDGTGSGGGGSGESNSFIGGDGGDGVVIVRYSQVPETPANVSISSLDGGARLTYDTITHWGGGTLDLQYRVNSGGGFGSWTSLGENDGSTDIALVNGTLYDVELRATNSLGNASSSVTGLAVIPSLVGEVLRFDATNPLSYGGSGSIWTDIAGSRTGTTQGDPEFDARSKAFEFDGLGDYIDVASITTDFSNGLAIHVVVDFGDAQNYERVFEFTNSDGTAGTIAFGRYGTENTLYFEVYQGSTSSNCYSRNDAIQEGFHAYSVILSSSGDCTFQRDGVTLTENQDSTALLPNTVVRDTNYLGVARGGSSEFFKGSLQSIIVYNTGQVVPTCVPNEITYTGDGTVGETSVPYKLLAFTTGGICNWEVPTGVATVDAFVVAGGGGGGAHVGSGGGAGGVVEISAGSSTMGVGGFEALDGVTDIDITVGLGGAAGELFGAPCGNPTSGITGDEVVGLGLCNDPTKQFRARNGFSSSIEGFTAAVGGGSGGHWDYYYPRVGGSGGGASGATDFVAAKAGTSGQGNSGGARAADYFTGGGGGWGSAGLTGVDPTGPGAGGAGDSTVLLTTTHSSTLAVGEVNSGSVFFAGGGGGGFHGTPTTRAAGGVGGGGAGNLTEGARAVEGASNTGGGGGGSGGNNIGNSFGADGGSGVVLIRFSTAPGAPVSLAATPRGESVALTWSASSHTGGSSATDYVIEYQESGAGSWTVFSDAVSTTTSATVTGLTNGTSYNFRVRSVNANGTGVASSSVSGVPVSGTDRYLDFDGSNDYLSASGQIVPNGQRFTLEAWVYDEATTDGDRGILRLGDAINSRVYIVTEKTSSSNKIRLGLNGTSGGISADIDLPQHEWVHVALTREGSDWHFYLNGSLVKSGTVTAEESDGGLLIGSGYNGAQLWDGRIDQVKVWDYTLTEPQIRQSMHVHQQAGVTGAGTGGANAPDLISHYDFNVVNTTTITDLVGSHNLTVNGSMTSADFVDVAEVSTVNGVRTVTFPRSYLNGLGGYSLSSAVDSLTALAVGAGGGGGADSGAGGGGGARLEGAVSLGAEDAAVLRVVVGQGGLGGSWSSVAASGPRAWATSGQTSSLTFVDSSDGTLAFNAAGGLGGANNQENSTNNYGGANTGAGASTPSAPNDSSTPLSVTGSPTGVAGGNGGAARSGGYSSRGVGGNASGGGTSPALNIAFGGGGGGGASGDGYSGGIGVNGGGSGATTTIFATAGVANRGGGGGAGSAQGSTTPRFPNTRDGFAGGSGFVAIRYDVVTPPTINTDPVDSSVQAGANPSFSVAASASPGTLSYQWQVSTNNGGTWSDIPSATSTNLSLTAVTVAMTNNQYRVVVSNTVGGESAPTISSAATLTVQDGVTVTGAFCDGSYTKNGLTVDSGHGTVFYIDTGQGQEIDAGYIAYIVESANARNDLWVEVTNFTGGVVSLANVNASTLPLGAITAGGSDTAFFMVKATGATTTAQSHIVNIYSQKPTIGNPQPLYSCGYSFVEVAETIKAAANKVQSVTSTTATRIGSTMTITVQGDSGTIGQGNDIDGRMIWVTPAARSDWPTDALRLESTSISLFSDNRRRAGDLIGSPHVDTLRVNTATGLDAGVRRQFYTATYTFRIIGSAASTAPIIPIAMISSGTQVKHTDVGSLPTGGTSVVDLRSPTIDLTVTKNVSPSTVVNSDGTTTLSYTITLTNGGSDTLIIDDVVDTPDSELTFKTGTARFNGVAINDPGATGASSLAFSGPLTLPANSARTITYDMSVRTCSVGSTYSFDNIATARTGTVVIGSGSATQSAVNIAGNCGEPDAVVTVTNVLVDPVPVTSVASSVTTTTATISGTVDPNSQSGLDVRFRYSTNSNMSSSTDVALADTTIADAPYGVSTNLTGLSAGTTYYYVLDIEDPSLTADDWISGTIRSFTTDPLAATVLAATNNASSISTTSAVLNGTVNARGVGGGAKVKFEWATDSSSGACSTRGTPTVTGFLQSEDGFGGTEDSLLTGFSGVPMSYELSGLTPNTEYCYRILAFDGAGFTSQTPGGWVAFTSTAKTAQTISWSTSANPLPAGGTTTVTATATSSLPVTYASADTNICTVISSTGAVSAVANSGTCSITATQAGNSSYYAAVPVTTTFAIIPPVVTPATLVAGTYQTSGYTQTLRATGGDGTYGTWTVSSGSFPGGLSLNGATGVISGTPTAAGVFTFFVTTKSNGVTSAPRSFTITIAKLPVTVTASSPSVVFGGAAPSVSPTYSGFIGSDQTTVSTSPNVAPTCTSTYVVGQNAATSATTSCSGGTHANYTYTYATGTVTVMKFPVTITAIDAAKQNIVSGVGGVNTEVTADPTLRWTATSPLPAGQTMADVVPGGVTITRASAGTALGVVATTSLPAGEQEASFVITPSGTAGANYEVTYVNGSFTIQTPKEVPSLAVTNKTMTYGDSNTASTFIAGAASNRANGSVAGTFVYTYVDGDGVTQTLTSLSGLGAGTYLVSVKFTPGDTDVYYHDAGSPLTETMVLTIERKGVTVTAADKKKLVGALDPALTWSGTGYLGSDGDADLGPVTITRGAGEGEGSYAITTTGGSTPNYVVTHVPGTFYVFEPVITVTERAGVLTNRTVQANCRGLKPGTTANFILNTSGTPDTIATTTVASDGTCPMSSTLGSTVPQGVHTLTLTGTDPLDEVATKSRTIILLSDRIQVITNNSGGGGAGGGGGNSPGGAPPLLSTPLSLVTGLPGVRRPVVPPGLLVSPNTTQAPTATADSPPGPANRLVPTLPGAPRAATPGLPGGGNATLDFGSGVVSADQPAGNSNGGSGTSGEGVRSVRELAGERLGGFAPGVGTRIEVLGARTGARFVVTEAEVIDTFTLIRAIQVSIPEQSADFFALDDVRPAVAPQIPPVWVDEERAAIAEFFAASGLAAPVSLADLDTSGFGEWIQVSGSAETYLPGSIVYLTLTSEPLVLASAEVARDGSVLVTGSLPVDWLSAGEHRVRLVGIRALDGVSVDDQGEVQLSSELMEEIQRFDLGTQSTIAVMGPNLTGGDHVALRVVPLVPEAPWWTLWFILGGFLVVAFARWRGWLRTPGRRVSAAALALASSTPAVILGWLSTVTSVVWWALGLGLVASALSWFLPQNRTSRRAKNKKQELVDS